MKNSAVFGYTVTRTWEALSKSCNAAMEIFHCFNVVKSWTRSKTSENQCRSVTYVHRRLLEHLFHYNCEILGAMNFQKKQKNMFNPMWYKQ